MFSWFSPNFHRFPKKIHYKAAVLGSLMMTLIFGETMYNTMESHYLTYDVHMQNKASESELTLLFNHTYIL